MFGWRKRIGFISPTVIEVIPYDFYRFAPDGVGLVGVTCNIEGWANDQYDIALATVGRLGLTVSICLVRSGRSRMSSRSWRETSRSR